MPTPQRVLPAVILLETRVNQRTGVQEEFLSCQYSGKEQDSTWRNFGLREADTRGALQSFVEIKNGADALNFAKQLQTRIPT